MWSCSRPPGIEQRTSARTPDRLQPHCRNPWNGRAPRPILCSCGRTRRVRMKFGCASAAGTVFPNHAIRPSPRADRSKHHCAISLTRRPHLGPCATSTSSRSYAFRFSSSVYSRAPQASRNCAFLSARVPSRPFVAFTVEVVQRRPGKTVRKKSSPAARLCSYLSTTPGKRRRLQQGPRGAFHVARAERLVGVQACGERERA